MTQFKGNISFKFNNLINDYNKNETVADMYFDVFQGYEDEVINISIEANGKSLNESLKEFFTNKNGEFFSKIKNIYAECLSFYVEEENLGGEVIMKGGEIIFTDEETNFNHNYIIGEIYEDFEDGDFH